VNLVIVLDVPVLSSFGRKSGGRDIHERDMQYLLKVRRSYGALAKKLGWKTVDATRPVEEVQEAVWGIVRKRFRLRS
jgi:thymidylate kinase